MFIKSIFVAWLHFLNQCQPKIWYFLATSCAQDKICPAPAAFSSGWKFPDWKNKEVFNQMSCRLNIVIQFGLAG